MNCDAKSIMRATPSDQECFAEGFVVSVVSAALVNLTVNGLLVEVLSLTPRKS